MIEPPPALVQPITRALAELQTSIVSEGVRAFDGWLERFVIYTLVTRMSGLTDPGSATPISAHAIAASLGQPYETVRRHVNALVDAGLCLRSPSRILATRDGLQRPAMAQLVRHAHDCFVRFVEHLHASGEALPPPRAGDGYMMASGVQTVVDIMLAVTQTNRGAHSGLLDLVLFSTVVAANCRDAPEGAGPTLAVQPVRALAVAGTLGLGSATVSRHMAAMSQTGQLLRLRAGYRINPAWLDNPHARAVTEHSLQEVRRLLSIAAVRGFPFADPASAYLDERPPLTPIGDFTLRV